MNKPIPEFTASARITPEAQTMIVQSGGMLELVRGYVVDSPEAAQTVNEDLKRIKGAKNKLDEIRRSIVKPLDEARANAQAFFKPAIEALEQAEWHCKRLLTGYAEQVEAERREAQRKADEEARRRRAEEEAKAAAERAKAEEIARQKQREAEEAERARQKAIEEGNARAAAAAAAAAAKAREQAESVVENAEAKIAEREATAVTTVPAPLPEPAKLEGFSTRKVWKARLAGLNDQERARSKMELIKAAATDPIAANLLVVDEKALNRLASAMKGNLNLPGIEPYEDKQATSRTA